MKYFFTIYLLVGLALAGSTQSAVLMVDGHRTDVSHFICDTARFASVTVLKEKSSAGVASGREQTIVIATKAGTELLTWMQIADKYKLSEADVKLRVCISEVVVKDPDRILIDAAAITGVKASTERVWTNVADATSGEMFINISVRPTNSK